MKHYYSIVAFSTTSVQYQEPMVFIEPGTNVFTVTLTSEGLETLLESLKQDGIRVDRINQLDGAEQNSNGTSKVLLTKILT
jgi:hypothetical protein